MSTNTTPTERPILFSGPMVRAILEGRKTQTRRMLKPQPHPDFLSRGVVDIVPQWPLQDGVRWFMRDGNSELIQSPYGQPGDRLWVKETLRRSACGLWGQYAADDTWVCSQPPFVPMRLCWHSRKDGSLSKSNQRSVPSIHMQRRASRITLEVVSVRVERLQDLSEEDAIAEGIGRHKKHGREWFDFYPIDEDFPGSTTNPIESYRSLWESINGPGSWDANPWVWVVEFKRVEP